MVSDPAEGSENLRGKNLDVSIEDGQQLYRDTTGSACGVHHKLHKNQASFHGIVL